MTYTNAVLLALGAFFVLGAKFLTTPAQAATTAKTTFVAPPVATGLSQKNQDYLIGVISFAVVAVATVMAVSSMMNINYDNDTLLMVEVPEGIQHDE